MDYDICPKCKNDSIHFGPFQVEDGECGYWEAECSNPDCNFEGRQWMLLTFESWTELGEDGFYHDMPKEKEVE